MSRKLKCTVTGNWSYCSEDRWQKLVAKYGTEADLREKYVSRQGKKLSDAKADVPESFKNKVRCTVTGELCYISDARMKTLVKKAGSEDDVRKNYVSRVAARLLKAGKTNEEIKAMALDGTLPAPAAAAGTRVKQPKKARAPRKSKAKEDVVIDNVPAAADKDVEAFLKTEAPATV